MNTFIFTDAECEMLDHVLQDTINDKRRALASVGPAFTEKDFGIPKLESLLKKLAGE